MRNLKAAFLMPLALAAFAAAPLARAEAPALFGGVLVGPGFFTDNAGTNITIAGKAGYQFLPNLAGGAYISYNPLDAAAGNSAKLFVFAAEATYFLEALLPNLSVNGKLGVAFTNISSNIAGFNPNDSTDLVLGPGVAYDYPLLTNLSVGAEANVLWVTSSTALTAFNVLAAVKYRL